MCSGSLPAPNTDRSQDIRDRAILLLLAVYGLRSGEVVALSLEDLDWEKGILHVSRPKQRRKQDYPLISTVGEAILRYLREVRPRCASRSLFLTIKAPRRALITNSLHSMVSARLEALNICCPRRGPHALRHACAAHLVAEGLSLKQIGDHLGHRSAYATRTYAKVDLVGLRQVADFDLGGSAMKLSQAIAAYVAYKQSLGMRFATEARTLKSFCRALGDVDTDRGRFYQVHAYLAGNGPITRFWHRKLDALRGFYRFALARGYATCSPLPTAIPEQPQAFAPYIYSRDDIKRLLEATTGRERCNLSSLTCRTLLLLLYGTGLRISEAVGLDLADVDLDAGILHIRESKFYKTRFVPTGPDLTRVLARMRPNVTSSTEHSRCSLPADATRTASVASRRRECLQANT